MRSQNKDKQFNQMAKGIRRSVERWNTLYPLDKWYRDRYNIRYNSQEHQSTEIVDIRFAFEEERVYAEAIRHLSKRDERKPYHPGTGQWLRPQESDDNALSKEEIDDIYDRVDISKLDDDSDEIYLEE